MPLLSKSKLLTLIFATLLVALLLLLYFARNKNIIINDNHPNINMKNNPSFDYYKFDQTLGGILTFHNIKRVTIDFTDIPQANIQKVSGINGKFVDYVGYQFEENENGILIHIFVNHEATSLLNKSKDHLSIDILQQIIMALKDFDMNKKITTGKSMTRSDETTNSRNHKATEQAQELTNNGNLPFIISE